MQRFPLRSWCSRLQKKRILPRGGTATHPEFSSPPARKKKTSSEGRRRKKKNRKERDQGKKITGGERLNPGKNPFPDGHQGALKKEEGDNEFRKALEKVARPSAGAISQEKKDIGGEGGERNIISENDGRQEAGGEGGGICTTL